MELESEYSVSEAIYEEEGVGLFRARRLSDGVRVLLKVSSGRRERDEERLAREYALCERLDTPVVLRPLALECYGGKRTLVFEDDGSDLLFRAVEKGAPLPLQRFLQLAIGLTRVIEELHARGLVHRSVAPRHVLLHPRTGALKITGLDFASPLPRELPSALNPWVAPDALPYMSPEQTGRSGQAVDYRSDLFSLGVTLFELRAGRLPFDAEDQLELIHALLARTAPRLCDVAPGTPVVLASIVEKLLSKAGEDRYQSAFGLRYDLERCQAQLAQHGRIDAFQLAQRDVSERFLIPSKLYGRAAEVQVLSDALDRVIETGQPELVLISGYSGMGKSALVNQLHKPLIAARGFFQSGKCDLLLRGMPYEPLAQACRRLVRDVLAEPEERVALWRAKLRAALGANAQLIVEIVPELERLIGPQPAVVLLAFDEAERRFYRTVGEFIRVFAQREHPLVLFLDDLQWVDTATLNVLASTFENPATRSLLVIGAYRDTEVDRAHPLHPALHAIRQSGARVEHLTLQPLGQDHLLSLLSDTLRRSREDVAPLAALIHAKTADNPFFVIQFLTSLYQDGLLRFDHSRSGFVWDLSQIRARGFTDNVVELMVDRLRRLPGPTRRALELAACVGGTFDVGLLAAIRKQTDEDVHRDLWEALRAGVLLRQEASYRFVHDRVHQAAYSLIARGKPDEVHLQIGRLLLERTPPPTLAERVFDVVNQLNRGAHLITCRAERERVAELNLLASRRAKSAAAYAAALEYAAAGLRLLGDDAWQSTYRLALDLHVERADSAYLSRDFEQAESVLASIRAHARGRLDQAAACDILVQLHTTKGEVRRACELGRLYLREFGIELAPQPTKEDVVRECQRILDELGDRPIESLANLPRMRDPEFEALMRVLTSASSAAMFADTALWSLFSCERVRLSLTHGNTGTSAHAYSTFALALNAFFGDLQRAHRFGRLATSLLDQGLVASRASVYLNVCVLVNYWVEPMDKVFAAIHQTYRTSLESGALAYACYASCTLPVARLQRGDPLEEVKREADAQYEFLKQNRFHRIADSVQIVCWFVQRMTGVGELDPRAIDALMTQRNWNLNTFFYYCRELQAQLIFGDYAAAHATAQLAEPLVLAVPALLPVADHVFFAALAAAQCGHIQELADYEQRLRVWAQSSPSTFLDRAQLVWAEQARLDGRVGEAMRYYDQALESARQHGYVHHVALGAELAAKFYAAQGVHGAAQFYLHKAYDAYKSWGATAKFEDMERRVPSLARDRAQVRSLWATSTQIDVASVMRASQTISSELQKDELTRTLVRVVVQQAGAQRASLILVRGGVLEIAAVAESDARGVQVDLLEAAPLALSALVPQTLVQYVVRVREPLILSDAAALGERFAGDPYIRNRRTRSILCLPLLRGDEILGCLYLENSLSRGAFTQDRLIVVEALASQAAISLESARLYDALRASEAKLADFFDGLPVGVLAFDAQGKPLIANRKATAIAGQAFDPTRIYVTGTNDLYPVDRTPFGKALRGESCMIDDGELHRDGQRVPLAMWGTPICADDGSVRYAIVAFQDISAQRAAEAERARLEDQLQLAERLDSVGRLAGGVAHDLNNLLMPMLVYSDMLMHELAEGSPAREHTLEIHEAAERASELVRQLLAVGRRQVLATQELELGRELRGLEPMLRRMMRPDTTLELRLDPEPSCVRADRSQIERAIMNLALNALDAMPHAGKLTIATENLWIAAASPVARAGITPGPCVVIRVIDSGSGMDAQTQARIFEPFFTTKGHGTGLGLPTVYGLVKQHGGHIDVQSEPGRGTTVEVFLPRIARRGASERGAMPALRDVELGEAGDGKAATVLIVDDDPRVLAILESMLARNPRYRVLASSDPAQALKLAAELGERLDVLVTDVIMPAMNGRELFDRMQRAHPKLRVLFVSGYSADVISVQGLLEPGFELMQKPFSADTLHAKLAKVLAPQ